MEIGLHHGIPMSAYLALDALGSSRLAWLATSPLRYRYLLGQPRVETDALERGSALHAAVLEPDEFARAWASEPDGIRPDAVKPRATKEYRDAVAEMEADGLTVLKADEMAKTCGMADAVKRHPHAARVLARCPAREVTMLWDRDGRRCRGRVDMLGDGMLADLKTTRSLKDFSPWAITRYGYYRQLAWYQDGLARLDHQVEHCMLVVVESAPPYDVGVFALDATALIYGYDECERLLATLAECEAANEWPGMFPSVVPATVTNDLAEQMAADAEVA